MLRVLWWGGILVRVARRRQCEGSNKKQPHMQLHSVVVIESWPPSYLSNHTPPLHIIVGSGSGSPDSASARGCAARGA